LFDFLLILCAAALRIHLTHRYRTFTFSPFSDAAIMSTTYCWLCDYNKRTARMKRSMPLLFWDNCGEEFKVQTKSFLVAPDPKFKAGKTVKICQECRAKDYQTRPKRCRSSLLSGNRQKIVDVRFF
jgi:hypothetical protein